MNMKYYTFLFLFLLSISLSAQNKNQVVNDFARTKGFENASVGFCVKDESGKILYEYNKSKSLTPASIMKVVTSATALEIFGGDYRFKTELTVGVKDKSKVIIYGNGDPTLGSEYIDAPQRAFLEKWASEIKKNVSGKTLQIEIDDSYFGYDGLSRKWIREDMGNYFAAGSYGISVFDNAYKLFFNTQDSKVVVVKTEPDMSEIKFTNTMTVNSSGKDNGYIVGSPFSNERLLMGDIPSGRKSFSIKGDIPDPGLYLGQTLGKVLSDSGFQVTSVSTCREKFLNSESPRRGMSTDDFNFYTHFSPPLKDIVRVVNVRSNNHYAEHLIRLVGRTGSGATFEWNPLPEGIKLTKKMWSERGFDSDALFMYDGSGLAPSNAVSPEFMCDILFYMQNKSKNKDAFFASLPKAGREGTVKNLLKGTRLEGKVHVKSGSIANVQCFAGYYVNGSKKYSFTVMVNNYTCQRRDVVKAIETLLLNTLN